MAERQIINPDGVFVGGLDIGQVQASTREYRIVAVVGCQSGGKSTLLNAAFGTAFPVLDAPKSGRRRTTLGVWAAVSTGPPSHRRPGSKHSPVVVLDVEGSDSRERGDGARSFESRTALLALALADVVVVNMWAHDIGRYSAANYELFETVFAHAGTLHRQARVFNHSRRVNIVMAIRDHDGESLAADIKRVLLGDLENIWDSLNIPDLSFQSTFNFEVALFPHKTYSADAFDDAVRSFSAPFSERVRVPQHVPVIAFEALVSTLWSAVCDSTGGDGPAATFTLDIPKHAALVAHFKCGEIAFKLMDGLIGDRIDGVRADIESEWRQPLPEFGTRVDAICRDALAMYDAEAATFRGVDKNAFNTRRKEMICLLAERILGVRDRYFATCRDHCMSGFEDEFRPMLGGTSNFARESKRLVRRYTLQYKALVDGAKLPSVLGPYLNLPVSVNRECSDAYSTRIRRSSTPDVSLGMNGHCPEFGNVTHETNSADQQVSGRLTGVLLSDESDEDDSNMYTVERFKEEVMGLVEDRKRLGELLLPGGASGANIVGPAGPKRTPWWKGLLIRAGILLLNYLQATQAHRMALKLHRKQDKDFPPSPTF